MKFYVITKEIDYEGSDDQIIGLYDDKDLAINELKKILPPYEYKQYNFCTGNIAFIQNKRKYQSFSINYYIEELELNKIRNVE